MIHNSPENENYKEVSSFYKKLFSEIPDLIFEFVIAPDNTYSFPLVSKSVNDFFELSSNRFVDSDKFLVFDRVL